MSEEKTTVSGVIAAGVKIGGGKYREVYRQGETAAKIVKPKWETRIGRMRLWIKFGTSDLNKLEKFNYDNYIASLPVVVSDYFAHITGRSCSQSGDLVICELAKNSDKTPARRLKDYGSINDLMFWNRISILEKALIEWKVPFFGINDENVLVREWRELNVGYERYPIIVDLKRCGYRTTVFQPQVQIKKGFEAKIHRAFDKLRKEYKVV